MNRSWLYVFIAGLFEIGWVVGLKHAYNWWTWGLTGIAIYLCMHLLLSATKCLPVGTAYVVFTGMGTAGTVVLDMFLFGESFHMGKFCLIIVLLIGVMGLKSITPDTEEGRS
ncbi:paired small multidrug resistance pump [Oceanobacillus limi]|uniref:Paired small multidrug resistance pump n=1 Tax=Oceanobacillus limi TaxID=930131 RepID=A0A1I0DSB0_9BACI|nr:multidrug efflux SMR transporter [Oceanobacillus limi]SET35329.1 paired small multidrug resistance pump [Oceanobacillus limi]